MEASGYPFEVVIADNGSTDDSLAILRDMNRDDPRLKYVSLSRNFGHQGGLIAALEHSRGDVVVSMDADLQHPPELIPKLIGRWQEGFDVVHTTKRRDMASGPIRRWLGEAFYGLLGRLSGMDMAASRSDFRLYSRRVLDMLCSLPERQKFIRGLVCWLGFNQTAVEYDLAPRLHGESKFRYRHLFSLAIEAILSFSIVPLRILSALGLSLSLLSILYALYLAGAGIYALKSGNYQHLPPGWATIAVSIIFFGGIQLLSMGLIGEYLGRVYDETKRRPIYVVREAVTAPSVKEAGIGEGRMVSKGGAQ
jgi:glycosyltransferase involved in cell wall biosynthesis